MPKAKRRSQQHVISEQGEALLKHALPPHWVLHPYRPDYGIDFAVETFSEVPNAAKAGRLYETLGEHLFIQLKSGHSFQTTSYDIHPRMNVEKWPEQLDRNETYGTLDVVTLTMDTAELATIERMGVGVPVLLVIADLTAGRCYFVCLNDYIDKILLPRHVNYTKAASRSIRVPVLNQIDRDGRGRAALEWYAKRPKLCAAFQRFVFQFDELAHVEDWQTLFERATYFARRIGRYDFWETTSLWSILSHYAVAIREFLATGRASFPKYADGTSRPAIERVPCGQNIHRRHELLKLWELLSRLPIGFEDLCREWFLPTGMGYVSTYSGQVHRGTVGHHLGLVNWRGLENDLVRNT